MNQSVPVFRSQFLSASQKITSGPITALGNKVVMALSVINALNAGNTCSFYLDGSYDGVVWTDNILTGGAITANGFGSPTSGSKAVLDYAFVRVRVENAVGVTILFDVTLVFSDQ